MEVVSLDDMDWFEFEQFVAHLFEKLGLGKAEEILKGNDAGRDIILRSPEGLIIVECKHHTKGTIGRPVVQKLHSAIITAQAKKGFIVTTGHFSENATTYARNLGSIIELVDSRILSDMANKARIKVLKKGEKTTLYHVLPPPQKFVEQNMLSNIVGNAYSFPYTPVQLSKTEVINTKFVPAYLLEYSLHQNFSTSVGTIHKIHINKERLLLNAQDGNLVSSRLARMVSPEAMVDDYYSLEETDVSSGSFKIDYSTAKRLGTRHIRKFYTSIVRYTGANNVTYSKKCVPNVSNILIKSLTQVYIPVLTVSFQMMKRQHKITLCGNPQAIDILEGTVDNCELCGNTLSQKRLLCNSCGKIVHKPQIILGHSYFCELCNRTVCKECTYWTRKYRLFKKKICKNCAEKLQKEGIEIRKLRSPVFFSYSTQS